VRVVRILFIFAALVAIGVALVGLRAETRQTGFLISRCMGQGQELKRTCLELELDIGRLVSPARLEAEGRRLEMDLPPADHVWTTSTATGGADRTQDE
jgi:hypothetical protein